MRVYCMLSAFLKIFNSFPCIFQVLPRNRTAKFAKGHSDDWVKMADDDVIIAELFCNDYMKLYMMLTGAFMPRYKLSWFCDLFFGYNLAMTFFSMCTLIFFVFRLAFWKHWMYYVWGRKIIRSDNWKYLNSNVEIWILLLNAIIQDTPNVENLHFCTMCPYKTFITSVWKFSDIQYKRCHQISLLSEMPSQIWELYHFCFVFNRFLTGLAAGKKLSDIQGMEMDPRASIVVPRVPEEVTSSKMVTRKLILDLSLNPDSDPVKSRSVC